MIEETKHKDTLNGVLPAGWDVVMLGDVADFSRKPRSLNFNRYKKIPFIPMEYIPNEEIYISKYDLKNQNEIKSGTFFCKGDLLVAKITPSFENGKQCIINDLPTDFGYATTEVWPLHGTDRCDILYLFYYLKKREIRTEIAAKMEGSTGRQRVPKNVLANFKIPLPPLPEQRAIAKVLSTVQKAKEKTDTVISATKDLKKSLMKHLFTYGPVPVKKFNEFDELGEFNELRVNELGVNELQNAQNSSNSINLKETEIGLIPEEWVVVRLGDIANFKNGINFTKDQKGKSGILTIDVFNMYSEGIYINLNNLYRVNKQINDDYLLQNGDVLFVRSSLKREGVGWTSLFRETQEPITFCGFVIRARLKLNNISPEFLTNYLRTNNARENLIASSGKVAITNINQGMLGRISVPLPPLPVQQKIATILSAVDRKIETEETKKKTLDELFKSLLHNLMTGKVRVNHIEVMI